MSTRSAVDQPWGEPVNLGSVVNSSFSDTSPTLTADGLALFFESERPGGFGVGDIWMCTRRSLNDPWDKPVNLGRGVNTNNWDSGPELADDDTALYFSSRGFGTHGDSDIWILPIRRPDSSSVSSSKPDGPSATDSPAAPQMVELPNGWQIGVPVPLGPPINAAKVSEKNPTLPSDGLTLVYGALHARASVGLWISTRSSIDQPWNEPVQLMESADDSASLSADGLTMVFTSAAPGGAGNRDLWMTRRPSGDASFGSPENLGPIVNSSDDDVDPCLSRDGLTLLFVSDRPDGCGNYDIWMSKRPTIGDPWSEPVNLGPVVNSVGMEGNLDLSDDGLALVFSSKRDGTYGNFDLWISTRSAIDKPWCEPVNLGPRINTPKVDGGPEFALNDTVLYFHRRRQSDDGNDSDIWFVPIKRPEPGADSSRVGQATNAKSLQSSKPLSGTQKTSTAKSPSAGPPQSKPDDPSATKTEPMKADAPPSTVPSVAPLELVRTLEGHESRVESIDVSSDGRLAVSGGDDGTVRLWDIQIGDTRHVFDVGSCAVDLSPDGRFVAAGTGVGRVSIWDLKTYAEYRNLQEGTGAVAGLCFSPDSRFILAASRGSDGTLRYWDVEGGKAIHSFPLDVEIKSHCGTKITGDGRLGVVYPRFQHPAIVYVFDLQAGKELRRFEVAGGGKSTGSIAVSSDSSTMLVSRYENTAVCDLVTGAAKRLFGSISENVAFLPDDRHAVC